MGFHVTSGDSAELESIIVRQKKHEFSLYLCRYPDMKIRGETKVEQARGCRSQPPACTPIGI